MTRAVTLHLLRHEDRDARPRLGVQGIELLTTGRISLAEVVDSAAVPDQPDRTWVDDWLHRSQTAYGARR